MKQILKSKITTFTLGVSLLLNLLPIQAAASVLGHSFHVVNYTNNVDYIQYAPDISGTNVVYSQAVISQGKGAPLTAKLYNINSRNTYTIGQADSLYSGTVKIDGNYVVMSVQNGDYSKLVVADVTSPASPVYHEVTVGDTYINNFEISGNNLIYVSSDAQTYVPNIFFADLTNIAQPEISQLTSNDTVDIHYLDVEISGRLIAWTQQFQSELDVYYEDITDPNLPDGPYEIGGEGKQYLPDLDGTNLVYLDVNAGSTTASYKKKVIGGGAVTLATKSCVNQCFYSEIAISGTNVIYSTDNALFLNNVSGSNEEQISSLTYPGYLSISGDRAVWQSVVDDHTDIYGTRLFPLSYSPIYRLYNTSNGAYLYTRGDADKSHVINTWSEFEFTDGIPAFYASLASANGLTPMYRLYNTYNGAYLYTRGDADKEHVMTTWPEFEYTDGVPAFYASLNEQDGMVPIYRLYNTLNGMYLYTRGDADKQHVMSTWPEFEFTDGVPAFYATLF